MGKHNRIYYSSMPLDRDYTDKEAWWRKRLKTFQYSTLCYATALHNYPTSIWKAAACTPVLI